MGAELVKAMLEIHDFSLNRNQSYITIPKLKHLNHTQAFE